MPMRTADYPAEWRAVSARLRASGRCAWCPAIAGQRHPVTGARVVLTVAHLNAPGGPCQCRPLCANPDHLAVLCQRCHLNYDRPKHLARAARTRRRRKRNLELFPDADCTEAEAAAAATA